MKSDVDRWTRGDDVVIIAGVGPRDVEELYRREARPVLGMLCAYLGDRSEAEDVLQEAFVRVQRAWPGIRDRAAAPAYLRRTAFNLARSGLRRRRRTAMRFVERRASTDAVALMIAAPDAVGDGLTLREDQRAVLAALQSLPSRQRACVVLRYYADEGPESIAATLGISVNSVKTHLRRASVALRERLEDRR